MINSGVERAEASTSGDPFYYLYIVFFYFAMSFVMINFILAIIVDAYVRVKKKVLEQVRYAF